MENMYYVPTIEEFHVGFEYEFKNLKGEFVKYVCSVDNISEIDAAIKLSKTFETECRVKYLNEEDIESLGWRIVENFKSENDGCTYLTFERPHNRLYDKMFRLKYTVETGALWIFVLMDMSGRYTGFKGTIKNKSELKILMKQLNITK